MGTWNLFNEIGKEFNKFSNWVNDNASTIAKITTSSLLLVGGTVLLFTPFAPLGAAMMFTGAGGLLGGAIGHLTGAGFDSGWNVGSAIGLAIGAVILLAPAIAGFAGASFTFGGGSLAFAGVGGSAAITVTGAQVLTVAGLLGLTIMFSKTPWSNKSPRSWLNVNDAKDALIKAGGDANKAAKDIMDRIFGSDNWGKGPTSDYNVIKKWLDRFIRGLIGK